MPDECAAFYHVWADGKWQQPLGEFKAALASAGFDGPVCMGVVGAPENRADVEAAWPDVPYFYTDAGFESITLNALRSYAGCHDGAVLYAHTKGSYDVSEFRDRWRRSMTKRVVSNWRENLALLTECDGCDKRNEWVTGLCPECKGRFGVDAVGCHWLTEAEHPNMFGTMTVPAEGSGFFGGNFWMARCDYLRTLPACPVSPRWEAEQWIGVGRPRVVDLLPGWPHDNRWPELC